MTTSPNPLIATLPLETKTALVALSLKFSSLGIRAEFDHYSKGPMVENFYFKLSPSVPISRVLATGEDLAFATSRESALVLRERGLIIVQLARVDRETVDFNQCLFSLAPRLFAAKLPVLLGKTYQGTPAYLDLADEPHALIAGSTGSGKSAFLLSTICSLAVTKTPQELQMIVVDSKQVDLAICEGLPHIYRTCRNAEQLHASLDYLHNEMRKRNGLLAGIARNIEEYNRIQVQLRGNQLPRIVLIIDEFADLLEEDYHQAKAKIEPFASLSRLGERLRNLAQLSRASGIHIIAATQRPSVKIVSGDLKVNLPCRIAFKLTSNHDSKTVLKEIGAESLLGLGDMLVQAVSQPMFRANAPFVDLSTLGAILTNVEGVRDTLQGVAAMQGGASTLSDGS